MSKTLRHPGEYVQVAIRSRNWTVTYAALALGVSRQALTNLLTGKGGISPEMAIRLAVVMPPVAGDSLQKQVTAMDWYLIQAKYDLEQAEKQLKHKK